MSCLLCVSFLDRSVVVASIQLDSVLVENAEYGLLLMNPLALQISSIGCPAT